MITFIVATIGRPLLKRTLASIEIWPGDEILVVGDRQTDFSPEALAAITFKKGAKFIECPRGGDWGHSERNFATPLAAGQYIAHIDDDDMYVKGHRALMQDAAWRNPGKPTLFRMRYPNGITLWQEPEIRCGNVGTPMFLLPNQPTRLGTWGSFVGGDCAMLEDCKWSRDEFVWRPEVIALLGHNT